VHKLDEVRGALKDAGRLVVLLSGGMESTLLAWLAHDVLGRRACALTFHSPITRTDDAVEARLLAELVGIPCAVVPIDELDAVPAFSANPSHRCRLCRKIRAREAWRWAREHGFDTVAGGLNPLDFADCRAGMEADREDGIWQPFARHRVTREEIREHSRRLGLPSRDNPGAACLCSRFPFGTEITRERLRRVEEAEAFLHRLGFAVCRVRSFPLETAVVEIDDMERALCCKDTIVPALRDRGFLFVTLDLEGYVTGKHHGAPASGTA
jgi:pyridinium-3,5-biscarboxylic acid mononucleotide sulfurtransferase